MRENAKRETKYDKLIRSIVFARDAFRGMNTTTTDEVADFMEQMRTNLESFGAAGAGSQVATASMSDFMGWLQGQTEHFPTDADHPNRIAARESMAYFFEAFPDYLEKRVEKRHKAIARGRIRTEDEYYLIQDYIYELEGDSANEPLLAKLYALVDNAEF